MKNTPTFCYFLFFIILIAIALISIPVIPLIIEKYLYKKYTDKSTPHSNNVKVWAKFPGDFASSTLHSFRFFDYSKKGKIESSNEKEQLELSKESITIEEKINYDKFEYNDKLDRISFIARKEYSVKNQTNGTVKIPSLGLFETLETLSNPAIQQKALDSIPYLMKQVLGTFDNFNPKIFSVYSYDNLFYSEERTKEILKKYVKDEERTNKLYSHETYGFKSIKGFYEWSKILGNNELIGKAFWLKNEFDLSDEEIQSLVGEESFLFNYFKFFNRRLSLEFDCNNKEACGEEILFYQLINGNVTKFVGTENLYTLNELFDEHFFKGKLSPELINYYNQIKPNISFYHLKPSSDQINNFFTQKKTNSSLYDLKNLVELLNINRTNDMYSGYLFFNFTSIEQMNFVSDYVFKFLPENFLYPSFEDNQKQYQIIPLAKSYSTLLTYILEKDYKKIPKSSGIYIIALTKIVYEYLMKQYPPEKYKNYPPEYTCEIILQNALQDTHKVNDICSDKRLDFSTYEGVKMWVHPIKCLTDPDKPCNRTVYDILQTKKYIWDEDVEVIYSDKCEFGKYLRKAVDETEKLYECGEKCKDEYITRIQFLASKVSKNPPKDLQEIASKSISDWDKNEIPEPFELIYYQDKVKCPIEDCNEKSNIFVSNLISLQDDFFTNSLALKTRIQLEKILTLLSYGIKDSKLYDEVGAKNISNFLNAFNRIISQEIYHDQFYNDYIPKNVVFGNNEQDAHYVEFLAQGKYYDNFKPKLEKITGFMQYDLTDKEKEEDLEKFDKYSIQTAQNDKSKKMRRIAEINNKRIFNTKKKDYSVTFDKLVYIETPLFNLADLENTTSLNDGYQYNVKKETKTINYYDEVSGRVFEFKKKNSKKYKNIKCENYVLNDNNISLGLFEESFYDKSNIKIAKSNTKFNKPIVFYPLDYENEYNMTNLGKFTKNNNFICIDPFTNMVLESNISLIFGIDTKNYYLVYEQIPKEKTLPVIAYNRYFSVSKSSYVKIFNKIEAYYAAKLAIMVIGIFLIIIFLSLAIMFIFKYCKFVDLDISHVDEKMPSDSNEGLVPSSERETMVH